MILSNSGNIKIKYLSPADVAIKEFGSLRKLSKELSSFMARNGINNKAGKPFIRFESVRKWKDRKQIPSNFLRYIIKVSEEKDMHIDAKELIMGKYELVKK